MLKVITSGILTTIQDLGRIGFASLGVPVSGAMDQYSAKLTNAILRNTDSDAVLEITYGNSKFQFTKETYICISGADCSATINNKLVAINSTIKVSINDILSFKSPKFGVRTYVGIHGGFQSKIVLNSRSFYNKITSVSALKSGVTVNYNEVNRKVEASYSSIKPNASHFSSQTIECFKGPEYDLLDSIQIETLKTIVFTISNTNSRMGYQLKEPILNNFKGILTSSVLPGTVQLTPSGTLIVLMRDCQVTGGYPRVLQLTNEAINRLAQKSTNDSLKFMLIN